MAGYDVKPMPEQGPPSGAPGRGPVNAGRLWAGGLATAVVAALIALVGVLVVRAVLRIALYAPSEAGAFGDGSTALLCLLAAAAALAKNGAVARAWHIPQLVDGDAKP